MKRTILSGIFLCLYLVFGLWHQQANAATVTASGICNANISWSLDSDGLLTITGTGPIPDYTGSRPPCADYAGNIQKLSLSPEFTAIGACTFMRTAFTDLTSPGTGEVYCYVLTEVGKVPFGPFSAFADKIKTLVISEGITGITGMPPSTALRVAVIPKTAEYIMPLHFSCAKQLTHIYYSETAAQWDAAFTTNLASCPLSNVVMHYSHDGSLPPTETTPPTTTTPPATTVPPTTVPGIFQPEVFPPR